MSRFLAEIRQAVRSLRQSPGLVLVATLSLGFGIAVNVSMFAGVDILMLRPLPFPDPDRVVQVFATNQTRGFDRGSASIPDYQDWRAQLRTAELFAYTGASFNLSDESRPERMLGTRIAPNGLVLLGASVVAGRLFRDDEAEPGQDRVVVLSERFWRRRFDANPGIVGQSIRLSGEPFVVVGVMRQDFIFPDQNQDFWTPLPRDFNTFRDSRFMQVAGRLREGATLEAADLEIREVARRLEETHPATNAGMSARMITLYQALIPTEPRQAATITLVAVAFVLLIACANVANLLLARGAGRNRELAVRSALGAGRWRLVRQLLTESMLLALLGGAVGVVLSFWGVQLLVSVVPPDMLRLDQVRIDGRILLYAAMLTLGAGLIFGTAPALQATRGELAGALRDGGRSGSVGLRHGRLRSGLVMGEIALALVLLISAGLLVKASLGLTRTDLGFDRANLLTFRMTLAEGEYPDTARTIAVQEQLLADLLALPGVTHASGTTILPMAGGSGTYYEVEGRPAPNQGERPIAQYRQVMPGYFSAMRTELVEGREFTGQDRTGTAPVMMITEGMARRHWPEQSALGQRIVLSSGAREIVGVVRDAREFGPEDEIPPVMFVPATQRLARGLSFVVRTAGDPLAIAQGVQEVARRVTPGQPVYFVQSMEQLVEEEMSGETVMGKLLAVFGALALLLAVIGVYGVMAYSVSQRTQEMGIRRALGAPDPAILRLVLRQGALLAGMGSVVGLALAAGATRGLATFLYGVSPFDLAIFGGVTMALGLAALAACIIPAQRATRVDPIVALRAE